MNVQLFFMNKLQNICKIAGNIGKKESAVDMSCTKKPSNQHYPISCQKGYNLAPIKKLPWMGHTWCISHSEQ